MSEPRVKLEEKKAKPSLEPTKEMLLAVGQIFSLIEGFNGVQRGYILSRIQDTYLKPKGNPKGKPKSSKPPKEKSDMTKQLDATAEAKAYNSMLKALRAKYKEKLATSKLIDLVQPDEGARYASLREAFLAKRVEIAQRFREAGPKGPSKQEKKEDGAD